MPERLIRWTWESQELSNSGLPQFGDLRDSARIAHRRRTNRRLAKVASFTHPERYWRRPGPIRTRWERILEGVLGDPRDGS